MFVVEALVAVNLAIVPEATVKSEIVVVDKYDNPDTVNAVADAVARFD